VELGDLARRLADFADAHAEAPARVDNVRGFSHSHGGLTYGFDWVEGARAIRRRFVIRLAPVGVRRSGNTDVLRQAPLLKTLAAHGFPVPRVCFSGSDARWFGTDYVVFEHCPGRAFVVWDPDPSFPRTPEAVAPLWHHAVELLARVHTFDWSAHLGDWEAPTPIEREVERWDPILTQAAEPAWVALGERVRERLVASPPPASPMGLLHGDCQPSNILFREDGSVSALLDWELSSIGSQYYDLGWLVMIGDRDSWHPDWAPITPLEPGDLVARYRQLTGRACDGIAWYRALANYKMAVVTGLYVKLHRSGRRLDPAWEKFGRALPRLFAGAERLLA
jgi:aminoglycoside phosphotransferase (APT) family kinase protein